MRTLNPLSPRCVSAVIALPITPTVFTVLIRVLAGDSSRLPMVGGV